MNDAATMRFRCVDTETTGLPTETDRQAMVEIGWTDVLWGPGQQPLVMEPHAHLVNPGRPIPPDSSGVHHIRDIDVAGAPTPDQASALCHANGAATYYVAHPTDFERQFFGGGSTPWICTHKCAVRVWQDSPNHQIQTLRYVLKLDEDPVFDQDLAMPPHRSAPDSYVLAHVFARLLAVTKLDDMLRWSSGPALLVTCYLPKHKGRRWSEVAEIDRGYLHFIVDKSDLDRDHKATARYWLKKTERV